MEHVCIKDSTIYSSIGNLDLVRTDVYSLLPRFCMSNNGLL